MAYSAPDQWSHGQTVNAAAMNKYSDSLNFLYDNRGGYIYAACMNYEFYDGTVNVDSEMFMVHQHRYLVFQEFTASAGIEIVDPAGVGTTESVSGNGTNLVIFDLDSVDWMVPGKLYELKDAMFGVEQVESSFTQGY